MRYSATVIDSPVGRLCIGVDEESRLMRCDFALDETRDAITDRASRRGDTLQWNSERCAAPVRQLEEYFAGRRHHFELPMQLRGSEFQRSVWQALSAIPYGQTVSYLAIAQKIGNPRAVRAVGAANGANPVAVIIPCHRVIGASGKLVGYGGGMEAKRILLEHERAQRGFEW